MKTIYYVDGYNLFYGALKHTPYKWLDIRALLHDRIVRAQDPTSEFHLIKYFTANIKAKVATRGQDAAKAQHDYIRGLEAHYGDGLEVIKGYYSLEKQIAIRYCQPPNKSDRVEVWKLEEKQTDVNIALSAYRDVAKGHVGQLVFVSNDSDIVPALKAIREDFDGKCRIGLITPIQKPNGGPAGRPGNKELSKYADWTRHYILEDELLASQLPDRIPTRKKPVCKPDYW